MSAYLTSGDCCHACGNPLNGSTVSMAVEQRRTLQNHPICRPCGERAEASQSGFADIKSDILYRQQAVAYEGAVARCHMGPVNRLRSSAAVRRV